MRARGAASFRRSCTGHTRIEFMFPHEVVQLHSKPLHEVASGRGLLQARFGDIEAHNVFAGLRIAPQGRKSVGNSARSGRQELCAAPLLAASRDAHPSSVPPLPSLSTSLFLSLSLSLSLFSRSCSLSPSLTNSLTHSITHSLTR